MQTSSIQLPCWYLSLDVYGVFHKYDVQKWIPELPLQTIFSLPHLVISNFTFRVTQAKTPEPPWSLLFLSHSTANMSANSVSPTTKILLKFKFIATPTANTMIQATHHYLSPALLQYLPSFPSLFYYSSFQSIPNIVFPVKIQIREFWFHCSNVNPL